VSKCLILLVLNLFGLAGCASQMQAAPLSREHPANPVAPEAPPVMPSTTLRADDQDRARAPKPEFEPPHAPGHQASPEEHHEHASHQEAKP
jgi:hypothetical protein